jgi:hypothetical protein
VVAVADWRWVVIVGAASEELRTGVAPEAHLVAGAVVQRVSAALEHRPSAAVAVAAVAAFARATW